MGQPHQVVRKRTTVQSLPSVRKKVGASYWMTFGEDKGHELGTCLKERLVERGGEVGEVGLGALQELDCVLLQSAVRIELEIGLNVGDDGVGIVQALMNPGEEDVHVGQLGVA